MKKRMTESAIVGIFLFLFLSVYEPVVQAVGSHENELPAFVSPIPKDLLASKK